jgi:hypothetical protein
LGKGLAVPQEEARNRGWDVLSLQKEENLALPPLVELAHRLFEENRLVPWRDADMTSGG